MAGIKPSLPRDKQGYLPLYYTTMEPWSHEPGMTYWVI